MKLFFFKFQSKHPNKAFMVPNLRIFIFATDFALDKFENIDFKYENNFSKLLPKTSKQNIFDPKFKDFYF